MKMKKIYKIWKKNSIMLSWWKIGYLLFKIKNIIGFTLRQSKNIKVPIALTKNYLFVNNNFVYVLFIKK